MISIHAPREGSDFSLPNLRSTATVFQSTLPARGATGADRRGECEYDISIHAPREGSDRVSLVLYMERNISIHAPREGSDGVGASKS